MTVDDVDCVWWFFSAPQMWFAISLKVFYNRLDKFLT